MLLYNIGIYLFAAGMRLAALFHPKARLWLRGRKHIFRRLREAIPEGERIFWVHAASLGEFEQGRPLIEAVRAGHPEYKILLTFFSPSGYEIRKNYPGADYIFYLPADTPRNARRFLRTVRPEIAVFVKYEFWLNFLKQLRRSGCRTFIVSAIFRPDSVFFRWYGGIFRRGLRTFERLFVQNSDSELLLDNIGISNISIAGDTRFDRVNAIAASAQRIGIAERFAQGGGHVFVAGSTWPPDEELLAELIARRPGMKFIIAPHEIDPARIERLRGRLGCPSARYTECTEETDLSGVRVLFIDTIGILSSVYRYADYAYIGGGFGVGIHNILEAATFGLPIAFGPNYGKFREAREMIALGAARSVRECGELNDWLEALESDPQLYEHTRRLSARYIGENKGATEKIMRYIFGKR